MNHLNESELMRLRDGQCSNEQAADFKSHLENCPVCKERFLDALARKEWVESRLSSLQSSPKSISSSELRSRLETRINPYPKEQNKMFNFFRQHRFMTAIASVSLVLILILAVPPIRAFAAKVLAMFRVQDTTVLPINISNLPENFTEAANSLFYLVSEDTQYTTNGQTEQVENSDQASSTAGFQVRLPDVPYQLFSLSVEPSVNGTFTINLEKARGLLAEINRSDLQLPDQWNGAQISFTIPRAVIANYGSCDSQAQESQVCLSFVQIPSPTINAPDSVDVREVGRIFLQISGMSAEEAEAFSSQVDWLSTLIIPIPQPEASYEIVTVDGSKGTLISDNSGSQEHVLIWVKNNILYAIISNGDSASTLDVANNLH